jgi:V8-like Glu-specific endopeptidase
MAAVNLEQQDENQLSQMIADLYQFRDGEARSRRRFIEQAGVGRVLSDVSVQGDAADVAWEIVRRLEPYGSLPERPDYHALGALLAHLLTVNSLPQDQAAFAAKLVVKYALVADPSYIADLRARYGIDQTPVRQPDTAAAMPMNPPAFEPLASPAPIGGIETLEQIITSRDNFLDIYLLMGAIYAAQAVCRIEVPEGTAKGTGFLLGPNLLLTNQHVLKTKAHLAGAVARFDYRKDANGATLTGVTYAFDPHFYESSPAEQLDYALVRLTKSPLQAIAAGDDLKSLSLFDLVLQGKHRGYLRPNESFIPAGMPLNIIQHPYGDPMKVVLTQNQVVEDMTDTRVRYLADTDEGSSGSPVFDQKWDVVALHHSGGPYPPGTPRTTAARRVVNRFNEGIPMQAILKDLREKGIADEIPDK